MLKLNRKNIFIILFLFVSGEAFSSDQALLAMKAAPDYRSISVKIVRKISLPVWYHEGLFYDGKSIWVSNGRGGNVWVVDPSSGSIASEIAPIANFTEAMTPMGGGAYFITDWDEKKLYRARIEKGRLVTESEVSLEPAHPAGVIWTGKRLFVITWTRGFGTRFDLLEMDGSARLIRKVRIMRIPEPCQMAWDDKNLWISSWYSRRVYKIDTEKMQVMGSFVSPVRLTTGIAWDGKYMWLTGTYGDLYQLEVS